MSELQRLANGLMLGTERGAPDLPKLPGRLGEVIAAGCRGADGSAPEGDLLRSAGVLAVYGAAAMLPPPHPAPIARRCDDELQPVADQPALVAALRRVLDEGPEPLRREALALLAAAGRLLPPGLLPRALALGHRDAALRPALAPTLGRRGEWLACQRAEWAWACGAAEQGGDDPESEGWEHGTAEERRLLFAHWRSAVPASARERLAAEFARLDARERASLLGALADGLEPADEDFIEAQLGDRSREVRRVATRLLVRLPGSRFVARMGERMRACLTLGGPPPSRALTVEPPEAAAPGWTADLPDAERPRDEKLGPRAWLLYQMARSLPLGWWSQATGMDPAGLLAWAAASEWRPALWRAWREMLELEGNPEWTEALLGGAVAKGLSFDPLSLIERLPAGRRERHWAARLEAADSAADLCLVASRAIDAQRAAGLQFSAAFSGRLLALLVEVPKSTLREDYALRRKLPELVSLVAPASLDRAAAMLNSGADDHPLMHEAIAASLAAIELRKILHQSLSERNSP